MAIFTDRIKRHSYDMSYAFSSKDHVTDHYVPYVYRRISAQLKENNIKLSPEAVDDLTSRKTLSYIINLNWAHRILHEMHSPPENDSNPKEHKYHEVQYADSLTWMIVNLADDIIDNPNSKRKTSPKDVTDFINSIVFRIPEKIPELDTTEPKKEALKALSFCLREQLQSLGALEKFKPVIDRLSKAWEEESSCTNIQQYRKAKLNVSIESANVSLFYLLGAGDKQYADRYFHSNETITNTMKRLTVSGNYLDGFIDFNKDKGDVLKDIPTSLVDRLWFLVATIKEIARTISDFDGKQSANFAGLVSRPVRDNIIEKISPTTKDLERRRIDAIISEAKNTLLGNGREVR